MIKPIVVLACLTSWCINMLLSQIVDTLPSIGAQICACVAIAMLGFLGAANAWKLQMSSDDLYYGAVVASIGALLMGIVKVFVVLVSVSI